MSQQLTGLYNDNVECLLVLIYLESQLATAGSKCLTSRNRQLKFGAYKLIISFMENKCRMGGPMFKEIKDWWYGDMERVENKQSSPSYLQMGMIQTLPT